MGLMGSMRIFTLSEAIVDLCATYVLATMLANLRPFFNNFSAKRAFPGKIALMNLRDGVLDLFLKNLIAEFYISDGLNGLRFTNVSDHFRCF
jgi:hypothetical protein